MHRTEPPSERDDFDEVVYGYGDAMTVEHPRQPPGPAHVHDEPWSRLEPEDEPRPPRDITHMVVVGALIAASIAALLMALGVIGVGPAAAPKAHAATQTASMSGNTCRIQLTTGHAWIVRSTGYVGGGRYWTTSTFGTTGDTYVLVTNRIVGLGTKGGMISRARGITGRVTKAGGSRTWGAHTRTPNVVAVLAVVDLRTGRYGTVTC
jgi:hypothetical protein